MQESALAGTAGPYHSDHLAAFGLQIDPAEDRNLVRSLPVTLAQTDRRDMTCHRPRLPWESLRIRIVEEKDFGPALPLRSFKSQGLHGVQPGRSLSRPDAGKDGDEQSADDNRDQGVRLDQGRDLVEVVDRVVKDLAADDHTQDFLDLVDVADEEQAADHADPATHGAQQEPVTQEDPADPAGGCAQRLHDADVSRLLDHDHRKDRQDAKPGDGDDHEEQDVQDALLDRHRAQQGPLFLLPGPHLEEHRVQPLQCLLQPVGQPIEIRSRPHLDLDLVDGPPTVGANQQSRLLQLLERNINVCRVILAHSALEKTHDREFVETRLWLLAGRGESQADLGAEVREVDVRLTLPRVPCPQRIADDRALIGNLLAPLDLELLLQGSFESVFRFPFDFLQTGPGRRDLLEPLRHLEGRLDLRAILVEEELGEITGSCPFRGPNADDLNRPRHRPAADAVLENARSLHGRSHGENIVTPCLLDPGHDFLEVVEAIHRGRLDHEIGKNTMQPVAHLVREPGHHRVDHDHRGDPEHDADHAGKRDVASAKIAPAEQVLVHVDHSF